MKNNIKPSAIARMAALLVALVNQCLVIFGQDVLPFTENMAYQVVSLAAVIVIAAINAWYNNDVTRVARLCGRVFDALSDGKITEAEIEQILHKDSTSDDADKEEQGGHVAIDAINKAIKWFKNKIRKE